MKVNYVNENEINLISKDIETFINQCNEWIKDCNDNGLNINFDKLWSYLKNPELVYLDIMEIAEQDLKLHKLQPSKDTIRKAGDSLGRLLSNGLNQCFSLSYKANNHTFRTLDFNGIESLKQYFYLKEDQLSIDKKYLKELEKKNTHKPDEIGLKLYELAYSATEAIKKYNEFCNKNYLDRSLIYLKGYSNVINTHLDINMDRICTSNFVSIKERKQKENKSSIKETIL